MSVWRINLKPASADGVDPRRLCIDKGIVGVGWRIDSQLKQLDWITYEKEAKEIYESKGDKSWRPALNTIYQRIKIDDLVWTRDLQGIYYIGRITSEWYYETEFAKADIFNVRKCDWKKVGTVEAVPGKIVNSFVPARTVQQVHDETIEIFSKLIYNKFSEGFYKIESLAGKDIYSLLSSEDCEDALALYLQYEKGYMIVPSSCKNHTMNYEYELRHRETYVKAVAQVKNGNVDLDLESYNSIDSEIYLFTTKGKYHGESKNNIHVIGKDTITPFLYKYPSLLPSKMRMWVDMTKV